MKSIAITRPNTKPLQAAVMSKSKAFTQPISLCTWGAPPNRSSQRIHRLQIPIREEIHSSEVSTSLERLLFETTGLGTPEPESINLEPLPTTLRSQCANTQRVS